MKLILETSRWRGLVYENLYSQRLIPILWKFGHNGLAQDLRRSLIDEGIMSHWIASRAPVFRLPADTAASVVDSNCAKHDRNLPLWPRSIPGRIVTIAQSRPNFITHR